ncbi:hypothetical protein EYF80_045022 [Liparis tanakae]|uniref:Uncharacterized protein n=1 Tax=Liparis tanakae TaxID=230148 RepID=A0A4Z2FVE6_9TELE|nr:hypothetical protein EYF80_045022 [Liparis tanakae]
METPLRGKQLKGLRFLLLTDFLTDNKEQEANYSAVCRGRHRGAPESRRPDTEFESQSHSSSGVCSSGVCSSGVCSSGVCSSGVCSSGVCSSGVWLLWESAPP